MRKFLKRIAEAWKNYSEVTPVTCPMCDEEITNDNCVYMNVDVGVGKSVMGPLCVTCDWEFQI